jgi:hypothetical protein
VGILDPRASPEILSDTGLLLFWRMSRSVSRSVLWCAANAVVCNEGTGPNTSAISPAGRDPVGSGPALTP